MPQHMTLLLAGAALALTGEGALAQTQQAAQQQAAEDTAAHGAPRERIEQREVRIYRQDDNHRDGVRTGRRSHLSDILQLRPEQQPALEAFVAATRGHHHRMVKVEHDTGRTTLQRLDEMQARMTEQQSEANRRIAAIKTFYAQLDARQKKAFDAMPMLMTVGPGMGLKVMPHRIASSRGAPMPPAPPVPPTPPRP